MSSLLASCRATITRAINPKRLVILATIGAAFLAIPPLARVPARLAAGCAEWIALAAALELLSMLGFVLVFDLVFGLRLSARRRLGAGFRALAATAVLPAGGMVGPAVAARTAGADATPLPVLARSTVALTILTTAPSLLVLGGLGFALWLGWPRGPHGALLTLPEAGVSVILVAGVCLIGRCSQPLGVATNGQPKFKRGRHLIATMALCRTGASEAWRLVADRNWKLTGGIAYYALDNAVLWAAFQAYGRPPAISVIVMGYLVGSLGAVLPLPAGIGAVEGGLIGGLVLYGAPAAPSAAAVLLYRGISLSLPVTLGALSWCLVPERQFRHRIGRRRMRTARLRSAEPAPASLE